MVLLRNKQSLYLVLLYVLLAVMGCTRKLADDGYSEMNESVLTARHYLEMGWEYDNQRHQMRLAELYYRKSYETLKDNPSQSWPVYAEAGYRYVCLLSQRGDVEGALAIASNILKKAEGNEDFPVTYESGLLSLMAQCQLHLAMPEAAKQTFIRAYEHQLTMSGGEEKGDFNLAILCGNIFQSYFEMGEYDEAGKWLSRYEEEFHTCKWFGVGDSLIISEHNGLLALYKAQYLQATGKAKDASSVYSTIPATQLVYPSCIESAANYLMTAGRYDEAADMYARLDTTFAAVDSASTTFDMIALGLVPRYIANRQASRTVEALAIADKMSIAIDSAFAWQKKNDAAELAVIYETHEKDLQLKDLRFKVYLHRLMAISFIVIILLIGYLLWRVYKYNKVLTTKNNSLYEKMKQCEQAEAEEREALQMLPEENLTVEQQLFRRLCTLMAEQQPYTDENLNRETLAQLLGTNAKYVDQAIRTCSHGETTGSFITRYRLKHVARLLKTTDKPISLVGEQAGIPSRVTLARLFRNAYGMTCSEYRQAARTEN